MTQFDVLIFAGGRSSRMGGPDKATLTLDGRPLIERVINAARLTGAQRVVVVGPESVTAGADIVVRESPPFSGPGAALAAGIAEVEASWMLMLSCDLENPHDLCATLTAVFDSATTADGIVLVDSQQREQWLAGYYRTESVRAALAAVETDGIALYTVLGALDLFRIEAPSELVADIDTPADLTAARLRLHDRQQAPSKETP